MVSISLWFSAVNPTLMDLSWIFCLLCCGSLNSVIHTVNSQGKQTFQTSTSSTAATATTYYYHHYSLSLSTLLLFFPFKVTT